VRQVHGKWVICVGASQVKTHGVPSVGVVSVLEQQFVDRAGHDATNLHFWDPRMVQDINLFYGALQITTGHTGHKMNSHYAKNLLKSKILGFFCSTIITTKFWSPKSSEYFLLNFSTSMSLVWQKKYIFKCKL
jgi:hypothetical protein